MPVEHGGVKPGGAEREWDASEVDAGFEQMGGVRMSEGRQSTAEFGNAGPLCGFAAGALDPGPTPGKSGGRAVLVIAPGGGEEPGGMTGCGPGPSQKPQSILRQGDVTVLGALASVAMAHHALGIAIEHLQAAPCLEPASEAGAGGAIDLIVPGGGSFEEASALLGTEDGGQTVCGFRADTGQDMPGALENVRGEQTDATGADAHGVGGEVGDMFAVQEVLLTFRFREELW